MLCARRLLPAEQITTPLMTMPLHRTHLTLLLSRVFQASRILGRKVQEGTCCRADCSAGAGAAALADPADAVLLAVGAAVGPAVGSAEGAAVGVAAGFAAGFAVGVADGADASADGGGEGAVSPASEGLHGIKSLEIPTGLFSWCLELQCTRTVFFF